MPYVEMGQGTYTSLPMLLAEELEVGPRPGAAGARSAQREALRQSAPGHPGDGISTAIRAVWTAAAPGRRGRAHPADRGRGEAMGRRSGVLPRAKRRGLHAATGAPRATASWWPTPPACRCPADVALKDPKDFKLIGTPAKRLDTPAKVNGTRHLRHRPGCRA